MSITKIDRPPKVSQRGFKESAISLSRRPYDVLVIEPNAKNLLHQWEHKRHNAAGEWASKAKQVRNVSPCQDDLVRK